MGENGCSLKTIKDGSACDGLIQQLNGRLVEGVCPG